MFNRLVSIRDHSRPFLKPGILSSFASVASANNKSTSASLAPTNRRACVVHNITDHLVPYVTAWRWQKAAQRRAIDAQREGRAGVHPDIIFLVEHPSVYTLGRGASLEHLKFNYQSQREHDVHRVERGGEVTWHGPGQIVAYPVFDLTMHKKDLHWYCQSLENAAIATLASYGVEGERDPAGTGVWVQGKKVAAVGLAASRWVTMHGLSLNLASDLVENGGFKRIVPCGIEGREVTSLGLELNRPVDPAMARKRLLQAISDAFHLELQAAPAHLATGAATTINSEISEEGDRFLWGDANLDDAVLSNDEWLVKHQRPL